MEDRVERVNGRCMIQEDRISTLPDELLHHIFSFVDSSVAVQTCVLSKRWRYLWYTLPFLNFQYHILDRNGVYYRKFVTDFISNRNQHSDTCSIQIRFDDFDESTTRMIVEYAISHKVEKFLIFSGKIDYSLAFPILRNLSLSFCEVNLVNWSLPSLETLHYGYGIELADVSLSFQRLRNLHLKWCKANVLNWSLPSLTTLRLERVIDCFVGRRLNFQRFSNLQKLSLINCRDFSGVEVVEINFPNLTSLTISHCYRPLTCAFMVSAPNLSFFAFQGQCVPILSAVDGFPLLKQVNLDIYISNYEWKEYNSEEKKNQVIQKIISLFHELHRTQFLTISFTTIQVLSRLPRISEYHPSPFDNLKYLSMVASRCTTECLIDLPDHVIVYLLSSSSCAKIFVEDHGGESRNYDPAKNLLLWETYGYPGAISNGQGNGEGIHKVLGVIPPAVIRGTLNDETCSHKEKNSFSIWEGHQIYSECLNLLKRIKEKHPETFENFAPQTDIIYTMGLNILCSSVRACFEDSRSKFASGNITCYKGLFSDLDRWGFNTTWLVNHLTKTDYSMRDVAETAKQKSTIEHLPFVDKEDRISRLPDELIHRILSFVESNLAVQTCVLSKRWVNIWSNLPFLNFEPCHFDSDGIYYRKFVTDLLFSRNQQSDTSSINIHFRGFDELITRKILDYANSHNVERFIISGAKIESSLSFPILKTFSLSFSEVNLVNWSFPLLQNLHISNCKAPLLNWSLPSLTTLHLEEVTILSGESRLCFEGFNNLKKLTLIQCPQFSHVEVVMINSLNLTSLTISHSHTDGPLASTFMVSAPILSFFKFQGDCVPMLSAVNGFPLLNQVNLDIYINKYEWKEYKSEEKKNQLIQKLISLFHELQRTKSLTLSFMTIQALSRLSRFTEYQPSPFGNLKYLNMIRSKWRFERLIDLPDHVIDYLLSGSPCAKISVEDHRGELRHYDPRMNMLIWDSPGYLVATKSKEETSSDTKSIVSNNVPNPEVGKKRKVCPEGQQATSNVQTNGNGLDRVLGVIPPDIFHRAVNDKACSYSENNSFLLWEGHQVYSEYVDLLTRIKEKHPETFEHFTPKTNIMYTLGLNTLCSTVKAFSENSSTTFTDSNSSIYRDLFTDLERWGFSTTWLVNHLSSAERLVL